MADAGGASTATAQGVLAAHDIVVSHRTSRNDGSRPGATTPSASRPVCALGGRWPTTYTHLATRAAVPLTASPVAGAVRVLAGQRIVARNGLAGLVPLSLGSPPRDAVSLVALGFAFQRHRFRQ